MFDAYKKKLLNSGGAGDDKVTVLVVDDNEVDRTFVTRSLDKAGFRVISAVNGTAALDTIRTDKPDIIILDCDMPVMNGIEMIQALKDDPETDDIPVVFLTGSETPKNVIEAFASEAENYLSKPISAKVLIREIHAILNEASSA